LKELNEDGLVPGQSVDFETINRINNQRKLAEQVKPAEAKTRGRTKTA
tara:strand:- start:363 stop:506 length:144 start_codon:yes stop_codon:yes gene_type:complete